MSGFTKKELQPAKRVCHRLKEMRESKGISLDELAKRTKLDKRVLIAIEECRFGDLNYAPIYQKNFIKCYVRVLGLNPEPFIKQYIDEETTETQINHPKKAIKFNLLSRLPTILKFVSTTAVILLLIVYLGSQIKNLTEPPELQIFFPQDGYITNHGSLMIHGKTDKGVKVSVNGASITNTETGEFKEFIDLTPGINKLIIEAKKKHGQTTSKTRHVILRNTEQLGYNH